MAGWCEKYFFRCLSLSLAVAVSSLSVHADNKNAGKRIEMIIKARFVDPERERVLERLAGEVAAAAHAVPFITCEAGRENCRLTNQKDVLKVLTVLRDADRLYRVPLDGGGRATYFMHYNGPDTTRTNPIKYIKFESTLPAVEVVECPSSNRDSSEFGIYGVRTLWIKVITTQVKTKPSPHIIHQVYWLSSSEMNGEEPVVVGEATQLSCPS